MANHVGLDFADDHGAPVPTHYAFLVSEAEFDQIFRTDKERGLSFWADPAHRHPGRSAQRRRPRSVLGRSERHMLEIITRPYGSGA